MSLPIWRATALAARLALAGALLWLLGCPSPSAAAAPPADNPAPFQRGVSLGLFSEDPLWSYHDLLAEIAALGATHVELVVAYYQDNGESTTIESHPRFTAPDDTLVTAIREAHRLGLKVMVFPIVRLTHPRSGEWRGTLKPRDRAAWWQSYGALIEHLGRLCAREKVAQLSVGSELSTLDTERRPWEVLIGRVRQHFHGALTYSGNWDHYQKVAIYDLVDLLGICGYFSLAGRLDPTEHTVDKLAGAWRDLRGTLEHFAGGLHRPLLLTEVGYLSQAGSASWPWEEGAEGPVDLEEQRRCYEAFVTAWTGARTLAGVYFWNWYGWGGPNSRGYVPRNKPAAQEIKRYFQQR